jgi:hypothetical protein
MKAAVILLAAALLLGCITFDRGGQNASLNNTTVQAPPSPPQNASANMTNQTPSPPPKIYGRYAGGPFSFDYPLDMAVQNSTGAHGGIFSGTHDADNRTFEVMAVTYVDTIYTYGKNKDDIYKLDPAKAASDFLLQDRNQDSAAILQQANWTGDITTYSIARDAGAAEVPLRIYFEGSQQAYSGYAMDIYMPATSTLVRVRIIAVDPSKADAIKQEFLLSFRPE